MNGPYSKFTSCEDNDVWSYHMLFSLLLATYSSWAIIASPHLYPIKTLQSRKQEENKRHHNHIKNTLPRAMLRSVHLNTQHKFHLLLKCLMTNLIVPSSAQIGFIFFSLQWIVSDVLPLHKEGVVRNWTEEKQNVSVHLPFRAFQNLSQCMNLL